MNGYANESGKFVASVSTYVQSQDDLKADETVLTRLEIPELIENPDKRPVFIQYAEEYFGKYWMITLILIFVLVFRGK